ncbi:GNAT family N-acetyltransferase [Flammeovirga sp. SJP92]|uniref:GNAT family N-acetyltransferase n=1 Tax=Flammeovirga sp. SJP92 TaxID=1775430 RepID=UPI000788E984|nr:GNAT family N-acetyltransferase [Flammeovirga sp. SJP92]KXX70668.1 GCN5 family acetyltransferase [Flammeovirga sp. SJP92]
MNITISNTRTIDKNKIVKLYELNEWSAAQKPDVLYQALINSHSLVSAWDGDELVGIGNAISDGFLVVYYPHLLIHPEYQGKGIGKMIMEKMFLKYKGFHMQMLTSDGEAVRFYEKMGFTKAGNTTPMWIYDGKEH